jgi:asparagine synthase (glutamine-hydrolysing)
VCGITGWVDHGRDLRGEREAVERMTATMACRGPDDGGSWSDRHALLGHRRLAIIDLEGGRQPMTVEADGRCLAALSYSGEVYNFRELRAELVGRGRAFRTGSDTEVVLRGYLEWGDAVAERLNGMYAFAVWDVRRQALVLVRDRLGIKPLYWYRTGGGVLFGSEPKAILAHPGVTPAVDLDGLREMLVLAATPRHAVWRGMRAVEPGTVVTVTAAGVTERTYWSLPARPHTDGPEATVRHVRELLEDTVARQLVSDVPRCTLLSGGLDSSAITALAARHLAGGERVRSFTVDFTGQAGTFFTGGETPSGGPDAPFAHELAAHAGTEHRAITLDAARLADPDVRAAVVRARDVPMGAGDTDASLYLLFRAIREGSTVALSGESADEIFAGYRWMHDPAAWRAGTFPWLTVVPRRLAERTTLFTDDLARELDLGTYLRDGYRTAVAAVPTLAGESPDDRDARIASHLHLTGLLRILLDRKDRMSMATGLEVRVPFCDHRLVEYVHNVPWRLKTADGREKSLLRAATADLLPGSILNRVKSHYPTTRDPGYDAALRAQAADLVASPAHPLFALLDRDRLAAATKAPAGPDLIDRLDLELALDLATWLDIYSPSLP